MSKKLSNPVDLIEAYNKLSQEAFSVWMRLHMASDEELCHRGRLAMMLRYSESRSNAILRELRLAGYIDFHPAEERRHPTTISIRKNCKIVGRNRFVRLSYALGSSDRKMTTEVGFHDLCKVNLHKQFAQTRSEPARSQEQTIYDEPEEADLKRESLDHKTTCTNSEKSAKTWTLKTGQKSACKLANTENRGQCKNGKLTLTESGHFHSIAAKVEETADGHPRKCLERVKFYTLDGGIECGLEEVQELKSTPALRSNSRLDLNSFSPDNRRAKRDSLRATLPLHPESGQPIDWSKLDQAGKPQITFSPSDEERARLAALLTAPPQRLMKVERKLRKSVESKLQTEFIRIYESYRRAAQRENGNANVGYGIMPGERKYAMAAAVACIVKGVTPRQVLEHWHTHIGDFADSGMTVPPLPFLSQPANIDSVQIALMASKNGRGAKAKAKAKVPSRHTMSDTTLLHRGLRRALMDAGFDLGQINDSYLTTIQAYAVDIAGGFTEARFIPSKLRDMVKWAAENVYKGLNLDDYI